MNIEEFNRWEKNCQKIHETWKKDPKNSVIKDCFGVNPDYGKSPIEQKLVIEELNRE